MDRYEGPHVLHLFIRNPKATTSEGDLMREQGLADALILDVAKYARGAQGGSRYLSLRYIHEPRGFYKLHGPIYVGSIWECKAELPRMRTRPNQMSSSRRCGSSMASLTLTRKVTAP